MKAIFADTSYWIALLYTHDYLHAKSPQCLRNSLL